jgi:hypothetical protein
MTFVNPEALCYTMLSQGCDGRTKEYPSEQIADAVLMFVREDSLAGRVMVWPDGEPWRLVPVEALY